MAAELHTAARTRWADARIPGRGSSRARGTGDEWGLATHDHLRGAQPRQLRTPRAARGFRSGERRALRAIGEQWIIFEGLGILAIVSEARGDLETAATTYAELARAGSPAAFRTTRPAGTPASPASAPVRATTRTRLALFADVRTTAVRPPSNVGVVLDRACRAPSRRLGDAASGGAGCLTRSWRCLSRWASTSGSSAVDTALCWWAVGTRRPRRGRGVRRAGACARSSRVALGSRDRRRPRSRPPPVTTGVRSGVADLERVRRRSSADRDSRGAGGYDGAARRLAGRVLRRARRDGVRPRSVLMAGRGVGDRSSTSPEPATHRRRSAGPAGRSRPRPTCWRRRAAARAASPLVTAAATISQWWRSHPVSGPAEAGGRRIAGQGAEVDGGEGEGGVGTRRPAARRGRRGSAWRWARRYQPAATGVVVRARSVPVVRFHGPSIRRPR